jgi:putative redox protein
VSDTEVDSRWLGGLRFEATGRAEVPVVVDGDGKEGPTPMETLLVSLVACMGSDVVDILTKMRVPFDALAVRVEGDRRPEPPRRYTALRLMYRVEGVPDGDAEKLQRAVTLSRETYCSALHSLRPDIEVSIHIESD